MADKPTATGNARVIKPGDPDHPGEQVKAAKSLTGKPKGNAVFAARIVLYNGSNGLPPTIGRIEAIIRDAIAGAMPGWTANVDATRTDK